LVAIGSDGASLKMCEAICGENFMPVEMRTSRLVAAFALMLTGLLAGDALAQRDGDSPLPFGLAWSMNGRQVVAALGAQSNPEITPTRVVFDIKSIPDAEIGAAEFIGEDPQASLRSVLVLSRGFGRDATAQIAMTSYERIAVILSEKYGAPDKSVFVIDPAYDGANRALGFYSMRNRRSDTWEFGGGSIDLDMLHYDPDGVRWAVTYASTPAQARHDAKKAETARRNL
jgi:hypothetical protein